MRLCTHRNLLVTGVAVDEVLPSGWTALMYAGSAANCIVMKYLLDEGADPNFHCSEFDSQNIVIVTREFSLTITYTYKYTLV